MEQSAAPFGPKLRESDDRILPLLHMQYGGQGFCGDFGGTARACRVHFNE